LTAGLRTCSFFGKQKGLENKPSFTGKSLRQVIEKPASNCRECLVVELADFKPDSTRKGRMLRTANFKYSVYSEGENNKQFFLSCYES